MLVWRHIRPIGGLEWSNVEYGGYAGGLQRLGTDRVRRSDLRTGCIGGGHEREEETNGERGIETVAREWSGEHAVELRLGQNYAVTTTQLGIGFGVEVGVKGEAVHQHAGVFGRHGLPFGGEITACRQRCEGGEVGASMKDLDLHVASDNAVGREGNGDRSVGDGVVGNHRAFVREGDESVVGIVETEALDVRRALTLSTVKARHGRHFNGLELDLLR